MRQRRVCLSAAGLQKHVWRTHLVPAGGPARIVENATPHFASIFSAKYSTQSGRVTVREVSLEEPHPPALSHQRHPSQTGQA